MKAARHTSRSSPWPWRSSPIGTRATARRAASRIARFGRPKSAGIRTLQCGATGLTQPADAGRARPHEHPPHGGPSSRTPLREGPISRTFSGRSFVNSAVRAPNVREEGSLAHLPFVNSAPRETVFVNSGIHARNVRELGPSRHGRSRHRGGRGRGRGRHARPWPRSQLFVDHKHAGGLSLPYRLCAARAGWRWGAPGSPKLRLSRHAVARACPKLRLSRHAVAWHDRNSDPRGMG